MLHRYRLFIVFSFLLVLWAAQFPVRAQEISHQQWEQLKNDKAFSYKNDREQVVKQKEYRMGPFQKFIQSVVSLFSSSLGTMLVWLVVIFVFAYTIYRLTFRSGSILFHKDKKHPGTHGQPDVTDDILTINWEAMLYEAMSEDDARMAIRCSYMWLLQLLQRKQLINYRLDKTNHEYYSELTDTEYRQSFRQLSRQYESAWYGQLPVLRTSFHKYMTLFNSLKNNLEG